MNDVNKSQFFLVFCVLAKDVLRSLINHKPLTHCYLLTPAELKCAEVEQQILLDRVEREANRPPPPRRTLPPDQATISVKAMNNSKTISVTSMAAIHPYTPSGGSMNRKMESSLMLKNAIDGDLPCHSYITPPLVHPRRQFYHIQHHIFIPNLIWSHHSSSHHSHQSIQTAHDEAFIEIQPGVQVKRARIFVENTGVNPWVAIGNHSLIHSSPTPQPCYPLSLPYVFIPYHVMPSTPSLVPSLFRCNTCSHVLMF